MKINLPFWVLLVFSTYFLPTFVSAAPNLVGTWKGTERKITQAACTTVPVTITLSQCSVGGKPGNLFKGTIKVGNTSVKILGRLVDGSNLFVAHGFTSSPSFISAIFSGQYLPAKSGTPARLKINNFDFSTRGTSSLDEVYDVFTLQK